MFNLDSHQESPRTISLSFWENNLKFLFNALKGGRLIRLQKWEESLTIIECDGCLPEIPWPLRDL